VENYKVRKERRIRTVVAKPKTNEVSETDQVVVGSEKVMKHPGMFLSFLEEQEEEEINTDETFITESKNGYKVMCTPLVVLDIDFKDEIEKKYKSRHTLEQEVINRLVTDNLDYLLYETAGGYRIILRELKPPKEWLEGLSVYELVDQLYVRLSEFQGMFRARLTPKPERLVFTWSGEPAVCKLKRMSAYFFAGASDEIKQIIEVHDEYTTVREWVNDYHYLA
jgi:hypothetical protein